MMNGIPIQFLDGIDEQETQVLSFVGSLMNGYTPDVIDDIDTVMNGYDLIGIKGDGSVEDTEKLRAYLLRTKSVVDRYPQAICGYQNPETFSKMLGYVLTQWDTANREQALEDVANEETRLANMGAVDLGIAGDDEEFEVSDDYDDETHTQVGTIDTVDGIKQVVKANKNRNGFFNQVKKLHQNMNISNDANKIVSSNPYFDKQKAIIRKKIGQSRKIHKQNVTNGETHKAKVISQNIATVNGLGGINTELQNVLQGVDFAESLNGADTNAIKNYLIRTKQVLEANPKDYFTTKSEEHKILGSLEYAIGNIDTPETYDAVFTRLSGNGLSDDEYGMYLQSLGMLRRQNQRKAFFKNLKLKDKAEAKSLIAKKIKQVSENPLAYVDDNSEFENVMGVLGYALGNWDNENVVNTLCGIGLSNEQYDNVEDQLGALFSKKTKQQKQQAKRLAKASKTITNLKKAYQTTDNAKQKQILAKLIEAEQNTLNGKKLFKNVKNAVKKAGKAVAKVTKKVVTAPIKVTVKATKAVAKTTAKVAKKTGNAIKKAVKKIVKFVIKYNPITLVCRAIILMACSLNMFKMSERMYPATLTETEALKMGLTSDLYKKSKECYEKLRNAFTKIGGKESKLVKYLQKGSKKVWKGGDTFSKNTLKETALKNQKNISKMYDEDEAELKKQGATSTNDPNVTYSETKTEVDVIQETAVNGLFGLIENGYVQFAGLGVVATATIASGSASASGILAGILSKLKSIFASGKVKELAKTVATKAKDKIVNSSKKLVSNAKEKFANSNIKDTAKAIVTTTVKNMITPKNEEMENVPTDVNNDGNGTFKKVAIIGGGLLVVGGIGYAIYKSTTSE